MHGSVSHQYKIRVPCTEARSHINPKPNPNGEPNINHEPNPHSNTNPQINCIQN